MMGILQILFFSCIFVDEHVHLDTESFSSQGEIAHSSSNAKIEGNQNPSFFDSTTLSVFKTGTTIVGIACQDGIVLGSDTRATSGALVMDKNILKIHSIAPRIYCCAAGTSADCDQLCRRAGYHLASLRLERELAGGPKSMDPVDAAVRSISKSITSCKGSGRVPSGVFVLGGIDERGPVLFEVQDDGTSQRVGYSALGSGSTYALAVIESARYRWRCRLNNRSSGSGSAQDCARDKDGDEDEDVDDEDGGRSGTCPVWEEGEGEGEGLVEPVSVDEAVATVRAAVQSGILNDLGSGSHVDLCVVRLGTVRKWRERMVLTPEPGMLPDDGATSVAAGDSVDLERAATGPSSAAAPTATGPASSSGLGSLIVPSRVRVRGLRRGVGGRVGVEEQWVHRDELRDDWVEVEKIE